VAAWEVAGWLGACALLVAIRVRLLDVPLERDEGLFAVIGRAILDGAVPYRDVFEHKPPGVFYVYALAVALAPATTRGLHAFLLVWCLATSIVVAWLARRIAGPGAGVCAAILFAFASAAPSVQGFSASSEMMLLLPLSASALLGLVACDAPGPARALAAASGALAGVTFWIKQPAALALVAVPLHLARRRGVGGTLAAWIAGGLAVTLALLPLVVAAGWAEFWYWSVVHSSLYAAVPATARWARVATAVTNVATDLGPAIAAGAVGSAIAWRRGRVHAPFALAFLALSIASAFHSQFLYRHYFALLVPAAAAIGGVGLAWACELLAERRSRTIAGIAALALVVGIPIAMRPAYWLRPEPVRVIRETLGDQGFEAAPMLAAYLRERTSPADRIFVYGSEPEISFLAGRRDVNPFVMVYPLTWHWPRHREFQERVWAAIERESPVYIVLALTPFSLVRSPRMDPFLETKLEEIGARDYALDAVLARDEHGRYRLRPDRPDATAEPNTRVFYELWRRRPQVSGG
jgi:4-amino-4-deoxy-L-arabinose transferase-like glycosyltransferase